MPPIRSISCAGLLLILAGCDSTGFTLFSRGGKNPPDESTIDGSTRTDVWTQDGKSVAPVDMIFMRDTSGSLDVESQAVTTALEKFLLRLEKKKVEDYCIGVILGHGYSSRTGALRALNDVEANKCFCREDFNSITDMQEVFGENFATSLPGESATDGGEAGLYSFWRSFTNGAGTNSNNGGKLAANQDAGCFRDSAALVPIFVSDENDISTSINSIACGETYPFSPVGPATVPDDNCAEADVRWDLYGEGSGTLEVSEAFVYDQVRNFQGILPFIPAIVGYVDPDTYPPGGENEHPYGYAEFVERAGGDMVDLALATAGNQAGFNAAFENLGDYIATKVRLETTFDLAKPACAGSIAIEVNGSAVTTFIWDGSKRVRIPANDAGEIGDEVRISYEVCE